MSNRKLTSEELKQKMMFLAGTTNINESVSKITNKNSKLLYHKKLADGRVYGIIQECQHYFVKVNSNPTENISVNDFAFIGGVNNALQEKFSSYFDAKNRINGKSISLNEAYGTYNVLNEECDKCKEEKEEEEEEVLGEEIEKTPESSEKEDKSLDEEIPLNKDIDTKKVEVPVEAPVEAPSEAPVEAPSEAPVEAPVEAPSEVPVDAPSDMPMVDATDLKDYNPESGESVPSDVQSGDEESGDTITDIQSLIGKLTQKLSTIDNIEPSLAKTTLNSVISATKTGIAQFTDKEKEDFKKRIETGGEKLDEEIANLMESNFGKRLLKKLIKEEVTLLKRKSNLNESDDDKVSVKGGYYRFNPSTKTFQTTLVNKEGEPYPGEEFNKEEEAVSFLSAGSLNESALGDEIHKRTLDSFAKRDKEFGERKAVFLKKYPLKQTTLTIPKGSHDFSTNPKVIPHDVNYYLNHIKIANSGGYSLTFFADESKTKKIENGELIYAYHFPSFTIEYGYGSLDGNNIYIDDRGHPSNKQIHDSFNDESKKLLLQIGKDFTYKFFLFGTNTASSLNESDINDDVLKAEKSIELLKSKKNSTDINQYYKTALNNIKVFRDSKPEEFKKLLAVINKIIYSKNENINEAEENVESVPNIRKNVKVTFNNGDSLTTEINGSEDEIKKYYIGKDFNLGIGGKDKMVKATNVDFL